MTKRLIEIDDSDLDAAREALQTTTIKGTVSEALRLAVAHAARRREIERLTSGALADLADPDVMGSAWR